VVLYVARDPEVNIVDDWPGALESVRQKISRAREHQWTVFAMLEEYSQSQPCTVVEDVSTNSGRRLWRVSGDPAAPDPKMAVVIGETLYQYRSALDHLAWQLVIANGKAPDRHTQFPICLTEQGFNSSFNRWVAGMDASAIERLDRIQPFRGQLGDADETLRALENLCNIDKHRHLNLMIAAHAGSAWTGLSSDSAEPVSYWGPIENGKVLVEVEWGSSMESVRPIIDVALAEGDASVQGLVRWTLLALLRQL